MKLNGRVSFKLCPGLFFAAFILVCGAIASTPVLAQSNFFGKAQNLLNTLGTGGGSTTSLDNQTIFAGLKDALKVGTERTVSRLGTENGYFTDSAVHIPLPEKLAPVAKTLKKFGFGNLSDDLELRMNRAAEEAAPEAGAVFADAISSMSLEDVKAIYHGPSDAATRWFQERTGDSLVKRITPIVESAMAENGVVKSFDALIGQYKTLPLVPNVKTELTGHVVQRALDGLFHYIAVEEKAIRENPAARSTELLKKVFGS
jgi:hypothetical protein